MPITKNHLRKIALCAWTDCYNQLSNDYKSGNVSIFITGDNDKIYTFIETLAEEYNEKNKHTPYHCSVECSGTGAFTFEVEEMDPMYAEYEEDSDLEDDVSSVIAKDGRLDDDTEDGDDLEWNKIRKTLLQPHNGAFWVNDHLTLALNWGNCINEKKHPKTTEQEWDICEHSYNDTEEYCYKIYKALCPERIALYWKIENDE